MLIQYRIDVHKQLSSLSNLKPASPAQTENYAQTISEVLKNCAATANNIPHSKFKSHAKMYWNSDVNATYTKAATKCSV